MTLRLWISKPRLVAWAGAWGMTLLAPPLPAQADFHVDVNLVVLHVAVAGHDGRFVRDLPKADFQVEEDGAPQEIKLFRNEDAPVAVGLVVDNSGSMRRKLPAVIAAAAAFAQSSNRQDQMFIVNFNEHVSLGLPPGEAFVSDPGKLQAAMSRIHARGETALYDTVVEALDHVRQSPLQKKVLIVVSDGGDNASVLRLPQALARVQESEAIVYTVGLFDEYDTDRNPGVLKRLAEASGGESFFPKEIPAVTSVLQEISRDIRNQYTIGYVASNSKRDGTYRAVRVRITAPNRWIVRTRMGYIAP